MSLSSFFQRFGRGQSAGPAATLSAAEVERVRQQAKRRLIGMTVLVVIAVLLLSWLLETEPRQGPHDVRIEVAASTTSDASDKPLGAAVLEPAPRPAVTEAAPRSSETDTPVQASLADDEQVVSVKPKALEPAPAKPIPPAPVPVVTTAVQPPVQSKPEVAKPAPVKPTPVKEAEKPVDKNAPKVRYVVQIGAFSDVTLARQARLKIEKLGFKTYTQVITTDKGRTIRVRVGPYTDEAEARHAVASIRLAGMTAGLLTL